MMVKLLSPNRAVVFAVVSLLAYWIAAMFVPPLILRDVFNALAFGASVMIVLTWGPSAARSFRNETDSGETALILAVFILWLVVLCSRTYAVVFNLNGRPEAWATSAIAGFWPFLYLMTGLLFLAAPGVKSKGIETRAVWAIIAAVAIGSLVAGILIGASISTV